MNQDTIIQHVATTFTGVDVERPDSTSSAPELAWGDTFFIYDPQRNLDANRRFPFATIVTKDYGEFDNASNLNREGVFRLNIGVGKDTIRKLFGDETNHDYTALDQMMPHPVYASQGWVCVLTPSEATFEKVKPLLTEAYAKAVKRVDKNSLTKDDEQTRSTL